MYSPLVCLARLRTSSHFSIMCVTFPPSTVTIAGVNQMTPWHTSNPSFFRSSLVPGGVLILILGIGLVSKPVHELLPSFRINFNIRGAWFDSSFAFGADTFRIFWIWTIIGFSNFDGSLVNSSGKAASPTSRKSYWKRSRIRIGSLVRTRCVTIDLSLAYILTSNARLFRTFTSCITPFSLIVSKPSGLMCLKESHGHYIS